jgi:hypothetical protein
MMEAFIQNVRKTEKMLSSSCLVCVDLKKYRHTQISMVYPFSHSKVWDMVLWMEALGSSETSVTTYKTADCNTHYHRLEDPKSHETMKAIVSGPNDEIYSMLHL